MKRRPARRGCATGPFEPCSSLADHDAPAADHGRRVRGVVLFAMFSLTFCTVDWRLFDPATLAWQFDGDRDVERLEGFGRVVASS